MRLPSRLALMIAGGLACAGAAVAAAPEKGEWRSLFDGNTLTGWVQRGGKAQYRVEAGTIVGLTVTNTPNSFLCTEKAKEAINFWRSIRTSLDFSAVLRQGGFIGLGHPIRAASAMPDMFRAFRSKEAQFAVESQIRNRDNYQLYKQSGLELTEHGGPSMEKIEEAFQSRLAEKAPLVAGSARAYTTFLNKLRADTFDAMVKTLSRDGKTVTPEEAKVIANFINIATGRGKIGHKGAVGLNTAFFAPRFDASRFQLLLGQPLYHGVLSRGKVPFKGTAAARKLIAQDCAPPKC